MSKHLTVSANEAADRRASRELVEAYAHCADRRDASGQMSLFTADTLKPPPPPAGAARGPAARATRRLDEACFRKPTSSSETEGVAGSATLAHGGGIRFTKDSPEYATILEWIKGAKE